MQTICFYVLESTQMRQSERGLWMATVLLTPVHFVFA